MIASLFLLLFGRREVLPPPADRTFDLPPRPRDVALSLRPRSFTLVDRARLFTVQA